MTSNADAGVLVTQSNEKVRHAQAVMNDNDELSVHDVMGAACPGYSGEMNINVHSDEKDDTLLTN